MGTHFTLSMALGNVFSQPAVDEHTYKIFDVLFMGVIYCVSGKLLMKAIAMLFYNLILGRFNWYWIFKFKGWGHLKPHLQTESQDGGVQFPADFRISFPRLAIPGASADGIVSEEKRPNLPRERLQMGNLQCPLTPCGGNYCPRLNLVSINSQVS